MGVTPHIKVSAKKALEVAQLAALKELIPNESDPAWGETLKRAISDPQ